MNIQKCFILFFTILFLLTGQTMAKVSKKGKLEQKTVAGVSYYHHIFGHIHKNSSRYSETLTTISCGHPVKIYRLLDKEGKEIIGDKDWHFVKVGPYDGYIHKEFLSDKRLSCFQDKFPQFFDQLNVEISDLYYWGRLYDQYLWGKSKVE